jgi:hypothetical protein
VFSILFRIKEPKSLLTRIFRDHPLVTEWEMGNISYSPCRKGMEAKTQDGGSVAVVLYFLGMGWGNTHYQKSSNPNY